MGDTRAGDYCSPWRLAGLGWVGQGRAGKGRMACTRHTYIYLMPAKGDTSVSVVYTYARTGDGCIYIIMNNEYTRDVPDAGRPRPLLHVRNNPARARSPVRGWWARIWIWLLFVRSTRMERTHLTQPRETCSRLGGRLVAGVPPLSSPPKSRKCTPRHRTTRGARSRVGSGRGQKKKEDSSPHSCRRGGSPPRLGAQTACRPVADAALAQQEGRRAGGQVSLVADRGSQAKVRLVSLACSGWWLSIKNGGDR